MEKRIRQFIVAPNEDGMRLDEFLALKIGRMSRSKANLCIKAGAVTVEPFRTPKPSMRIRTDDVVSIAQTLSQDVPMYDDVRILGETDDFWVFDKPAGMAVHPTASLFHNTVTQFVATVLKKNAYVVHRLDKETSGVLIVAKTPEVSTRLGAHFLDRSVRKRYQAVCYNACGAYFPGRTLDIDIPLGFSGFLLPRITMGPGSLDAHTSVTCIGIHGEFALLNVELHSGRQHQIRVHLALTGTPILGDKLYLYGESFYKAWCDGENVPQFTPPRHLLHAAHLSFDWEGRTYMYDSPVPDLMSAVYRSELTEMMFPTEYARLFRT